MSSARASRPEGTSRPVILHVSGDFPDPVEPFKTPVIRQLIKLTDDNFDHRVISINRVSPTIDELARGLLRGGGMHPETVEFEHGIAVRYAAPGKGILHRTRLEHLGRWIADRIATMNPRPHLIIGHKLSIEGIAVRLAAEQSGVPYALSIQGNTDLKILRTRPDLRRLFRKVFSEAKVVFPFAPWARAQVEALLGERDGPTLMLPCPTELDQPTTPASHGDGLISVFHLKNYATKNLTGIVSAYRILVSEGKTPPPLEIIGGGSEEELAKCKAITAEFPQIRFAGPMEREPLRERMNRATALVMPSLRESFGLVFIEALFAGTPVIYPSRTAVDGYFDDAAFALRVDARSPQSIATAMEHAMARETVMKAALATWQKSPASAPFTRAAIAQQFTDGIMSALAMLNEGPDGAR